MEEENILKNNKKKGKGGLIFLSVIILIAIIAGVLYFKIYNNPKNVFKTAVKTVFENADKVVEEQDYKNLTSDIEFSINMNTDSSNNDLLDEFKIKVLNNTELDSKESESNIKLSKGDTELINLNLDVTKENLLIACSELFSKSVKISKAIIENLIENLGISFEETDEFDGDLKLATKRFEVILNEQLSDQSFRVESVKAKLGDDEVNARKNTLTFTTEELINFIKNLEIKLKEDKEFIKAIDSQKTNFFDQIDEMIVKIKEFDEEYGEDVKFDISLFTKGLVNKFIKCEMKIYDSQSCYGIEVYEKSENDYIVNMLISQETSELTEADIIANAEIKDNIITAEFNGYSLTLKYIDNSFELNIVNAEASLNINIIGKFEKNGKFEKYDFSNSVNITQMTQEDYMEIVNNFQQSKLFEFLTPVLGPVLSLMSM